MIGPPHIVSHDIVTTTTLADRLWLLDYEHDAAGALVPSATISPRHQYNLVEMDFAWHKNVEPEFAQFVKHISSGRFAEVRNEHFFLHS